MKAKMPGTIQELTLNYDPVNETNTFTSGDTIQGRVVLKAAKEVNVTCFYIKCKGDADVTLPWSLNRSSYHSHVRYFKLKQIFMQDPLSQGGTVIGPGKHIFPFSFQLPHGNMPPSFDGHHASVKYILEVRLNRLDGRQHTVKTRFTFLPKICSLLMCPQSAATDKKMKHFTSGRASVRVKIDKIGYMRGDVIIVSTSVDNSSSRELKLKYSLQQREIFFVQAQRKCLSQTIFKVDGDTIPSGSKPTINTHLKIPSNLELTANCGIFKVEYVLKVCLNVPCARGMKITFPLIIFHADQISPLQSHFQYFGISHELGRNSLTHHPGLGSSPSGPAPPVYSQLTSSEAHPPSYTDIYPDQNPTVPGFQPALSTPTFHPPPYSATDCGQAENAANLNHSASEPESYPTEFPENMHHQTYL